MIRRHLLSILFGAIVVTGSSFASADDDGKVRVFVLAGQSNMEGHGIVAADPARNEGKGSLAYVAEHQPESPIAACRAGDGSWR